MEDGWLEARGIIMISSSFGERRMAALPKPLMGLGGPEPMDLAFGVVLRRYRGRIEGQFAAAVGLSVEPLSDKGKIS
jgi:hypothetical protein